MFRRGRHVTWRGVINKVVFYKRLIIMFIVRPHLLFLSDSVSGSHLLFLMRYFSKRTKHIRTLMKIYKSTSVKRKMSRYNFVTGELSYIKPKIIIYKTPTCKKWHCMSNESLSWVNSYIIITLLWSRDVGDYLIGPNYGRF